MHTIAKAAAALDAGAKSRELIEQCLARINDKAGEGGRTFLKVHAEAALAAADFHDRSRARGAAPSRFAGIPVSLKDLFDIAGDVTTAGSSCCGRHSPRPATLRRWRDCARPDSFRSGAPT
jgi:aspartyl-tRNA(Asn)/glutamyl-tRNA(Gln) amidotransferase subunit A